MENSTFSYSYSAKAQREIEKIRSKYMPREENKLEALKRLDSRAQRAGIIESLCLGIIGVLVFGFGMCFFLGVFVCEWWLTAALMGAGIIMMLPAYPIYKRISRKRRAELTPEIIRLSEELMAS